MQYLNTFHFNIADPIDFQAIIVTDGRFNMV